MNDEIIARLEFFEETYAGEIETWVDPVTKTYYHVPIEIVRDFDNIEKLHNEWKYSHHHQYLRQTAQ